MPEQTGTKFDSEKPRMDLLDWDALEGLAQVLTFGAQKYDSHNWRGGIAYSRIISSLLRHLAAIQRGEDLDPESGLPHIDHLGCNWMFLSHFSKRRPDLDDRVFPQPVDPIATSSGSSYLTMQEYMDIMIRYSEKHKALEEVHNADLSS
jgi:Domain of unknown function (DUF5664)